MRIACLGWGSLIWDPRDLPIRGEWSSDGPLLPIEFARRSDDGRVTLVLLKNAPVTRSLWALMSVPDLARAREALAERESASGRDRGKAVGFWTADARSEGVGIDAIEAWAKIVDVEAVIWTALSSNIRNEYRPELAEEVVSYLRSLSFDQLQNAERYIRRAPRQIDTAIRRRIEREFGWSPVYSF